MKILQNQLKCNKCGDEPYSSHTHHFNMCKCGSVGVDGGMDYLRRIGNFRDATEMSVSVSNKVYKELVEALQWAEDTERNELGTICAIFRVLRDNDYNLEVEDE